MIIVSDKAAKKILSLKQEEDTPEAFLRIKVARGGCSGLSYKMDFDEAKTEKDSLFAHNGADVIVDSQSLLYIAGMTLDYDGGLNGQGFTFSNPNATKSCGCGSSFAV